MAGCSIHSLLFAMNDLVTAVSSAATPLWTHAAVAVAYAVFTLVGFGSALLASGPLAQAMPVARVIPTLALLDCAGSVLRAWHARQAVAWTELRWLLPGMLVGQGLGVWGLSRLPAAWMAVGLGLFVAGQGLKGLAGLWAVPTAGRPAAADADRAADMGVGRAGLAKGLLGGVLGGLFGSGGFVYAAHLERRLADRTAFRATQAVLIGLSTAWRLLLCAWAGLLDGAVLMAAATLLPAMAVGVWAGHRIDLRISRAQLFGLLNALLVASGLALVLRHGGPLLGAVSSGFQ